MRKITKIETTTPTLNIRKKVAAYARVSVEKERSIHSLSAQVSYYNTLIQKNPEWDYVGVYADSGISGTKTEGRNEFQRMIKDCELGKIDIVLTKSISRFARNTVDLLETVRHLKSMGVEVRFEKENIYSFSSEGEVMLSILASFAQEESISISNNVKWGTRKRFEKGLHNGRFHILGYVWQGDTLVIEPNGAEIVRYIYQNFLYGKSRLETSRELNAMGHTGILGAQFSDSTVKQILTNITYTGNLLFQKEFVVDPLVGKSKINRGELPQYFVENSHEPIIDKVIFDFVQAEMARRRELGAFANKAIKTTCFTSKFQCYCCGRNYQRCTRSHARNSYKSWKCATNRNKKTDKCIVTGEIPEKALQVACCTALSIEEFDENIFLANIEKIIVQANKQLEFHFYNGEIKTVTWVSTARKDCWTDERRKAWGEFQKGNCYAIGQCWSEERRKIYGEKVKESYIRKGEKNGTSNNDTSNN